MSASLMDRAAATAMSRTASAAEPAIRTPMGSTAAVACRGSVEQAEEASGQVNAHRRHLLAELRADARRPQVAQDAAIGEARLLEHEDVLHDDRVAFHALDLGDVRDLARPILETRLMDDHV